FILCHHVFCTDMISEDHRKTAGHSLKDDIAEAVLYRWDRTDRRPAIGRLRDARRKLNIFPVSILGKELFRPSRPPAAMEDQERLGKLQPVPCGEQVMDPLTD